MPKIVSSHSTKTKINRWLDLISKPNPQLDNLPICPYLSRHRAHIHIAQTDDPAQLARNFADVKDIFKLEACVIHGFELSYEQMEHMVDQLNTELHSKDVIALMMHPEGDQDVLPIQYQFDLPLLIVQKKSSLECAQKQLRKSNYYKHYKY